MYFNIVLQGNKIQAIVSYTDDLKILYTSGLESCVEA